MEGMAYGLSFLVGGRHLGVVLVGGFLGGGVLDLVGGWSLVFLSLVCVDVGLNVDFFVYFSL